jgi:hypothetical protein
LEADTGTVRDAVGAMQAAICEFEREEMPYFPDAVMEIRSRLNVLLDQLKTEIGRIATAIEDS